MTREQYTTILLSSLEDAINDLNLGEASQDEIHEFFNCLFNIAPSMVYVKLTGENKDVLELNHYANRLIMESYRKEQNSD